MIVIVGGRIPDSVVVVDKDGNPVHLTEHGERVPPTEGSAPCDEYDPAGSGAGVEEDGEPQCAMCGWQKSQHARRA